MFGTKICAEINTGLPRQLSNKAMHIALDDLQNSKLAEVKRVAGLLHEVRLRETLPTDEQIQAMAGLVQTRAVYIILWLEYDATLESPLPKEDLAERIERRFPYLGAPSVMAYMVKGGMLSRPSP